MKFYPTDITQRATEGLVFSYFVKDRPETHPFWERLTAADKKHVSKLWQAKDFTGKEGQARVMLQSSGGKFMLLGLGERKLWQRRKLVLAARRIAHVAQTERMPRLRIAVESLSASGLSFERVTQTLVENMLMAAYEFTQYKSQAQAAEFRVANVYLLAHRAHLPEVRVGSLVGQVVGEQVNVARDLGNIPGGEMTPTLLAKRAQEFGLACGFKVSVLGVKEMKKLGLGALLGVAQGSAQEPKFIVAEYWGLGKKERPYVFVGKGVTFDSGGLNLKPTKNINDMHLDMLGGAAVLAALGAVARLKLKQNVIGLVPAVENMPGSAGYRPGDVLKSLSGKTIEVLNTDAEGRIILADALTYAERFQPKLVVDLATLTGACMVALGLLPAGLMTPDAELESELRTVGEASGDYVWPLPMWSEYEDEVKGNFGDVQNVGKSGYGDAIAGAMFLYQFAKGYPWAHLDIAGPMKTFEGQVLAKGASGVGVRFLVELVRSKSR